MMFQYACLVIRFYIGRNGVKNFLVVGLFGEHLLGDHLAGYARNFRLVFSVVFQPRIGIAGWLAINQGCAGAECWDHRQQHSYGCVKLSKLLVTGKGQVDVHALQV